MKRAWMQIHKRFNSERRAVRDCFPMTAVFREADEDKPGVDFRPCSGCMQSRMRRIVGAIEELAQPCSSRRKMEWSSTRK